MLMETPTLNKKQQKSTLSAKKARPKETIKNVVTTPHTPYWPQICPEDNNTLKQILEQNLPKIVSEKVNIPWRELKNVPKSERKLLRTEFAKNYHAEIKKDDREGVVIGVNDVTKLLEKNLASIVLISSDVQPKLMVQHVIDQAVLYKVPVIIFNNLRILLKQVCGISSIVLSIRIDINTESNLNLIKESVTQIFEKYPTPINHINYNRSLESKIVKSDQIVQQASSVANKVNDEIKQAIYLRRDSKNKRVFVPEYTEKVLRNDKMEVDSEGFLAFSQEPEPKVENKVKSRYKSLIVKRLKGNPNRNRRIIETLKRKLK